MVAHNYYTFLPTLLLCSLMFKYEILADSLTSPNIKYNKIKISNFNITDKIAELEKDPKRAYTDRVLNGLPAVYKDFPFATFVYVDEGESGEACTGSLIAPDIVVTAAHCLTSEGTDLFPTTKIFVSAGSVDNIKKNNNIFKVSKLVVHPNYNPKTAHNDVGLVFLSSKVSPKLATPTTIYNGTIFDGIPVQAAGWGLTSNEIDAKISSTLNYVDINISSSSVCKRINPNWTQNNGYSICSLVINGKDTCFGDSGGPLSLVTSSLRPLVGVTSVGAPPIGVDSDECGITGGVAYYTNLNFFSSWISEQTQIPLNELLSSGEFNSTSIDLKNKSSKSSSKSLFINNLGLKLFILSFLSYGFNYLI
ncbi:hypothetical protein BB561_004548 [Smittium simulii]|uniref:Peptidase S1 domain-containing protein n=1 Tax=Smittium simulii TaxID=133385 RepID=A0A2T9YFN2_9FUNG|nr:hypothetical protein BB561_004548 [Smittium simulii]